MIDESRVNTQFRQSGGSCVLSSYGIVANYFIGQPVEGFFEAYCLHFGLQHQGPEQAEQMYIKHFDSEWRRLNCRGYEVIVDLHNTSSVSAFKNCRAAFSARFILDSDAEVHDLEKTLQDDAAFLNVTYETGKDYHSVTVFHNGTTLRVRDTTTNNHLRNIASLSSLGKLRDSVLYSEK